MKSVIEIKATPNDEDGFRAAQRLSYACAQTIGAELRPGWTEIQTTKLMDTYLRDFGIHTFFHKSFAWFGNRTRFDGITNNFHFLPTKRELKENDVIILDTAPILNGYTGDTGYTFSLSKNKSLDRAMDRLRSFRTEIPKLFESNLSTPEIWNQVDRELKSEHYSNCHAKYPFAVLGHKVRRIPLSNLPGLLAPFSIHAIASLLTHGLMPDLLGPKNKCNKTGFWAIEPHLGADGFGAKFEEILVVDSSGKAYWLDDKVPHMKKAVV